MSRYRVYLSNTVSTSVDVEASSPEEAGDLALQEGLPGLMFVNYTYPDEGDWDVNEVEEL